YAPSTTEIYTLSLHDALPIYLKKQHHSARHWCYAYQIGTFENQIQFRANDDGEPNNSAGMPIYGQIQSFEVTNILIVVVRYFGRSEEHTSELQSRENLVCRLL